MVKLMTVLFALSTFLLPIPAWEPEAEDVEAIARTLYGECRGVESDAEKEAVAWVILNRLDAGYADTVLGVVSAPGQFAGYDADHPLWPVLVCGGVAGVVVWRGTNHGKADARRDRHTD